MAQVDRFSLEAAQLRRRIGRCCIQGFKDDSWSRKFRPMWVSGGGGCGKVWVGAEVKCWQGRGATMPFRRCSRTGPNVVRSLTESNEKQNHGRYN